MFGSDFDIIVAYAPVKQPARVYPLHPYERQVEVDKCKNEMARLEKYSVWRLLEKTVRTYLNLDFDNLKFTKTDNGQWICPDFCFSLSHTNGLICVAISADPIGVDTELVREINLNLKEKILTPNELSALEDISGEDVGPYLLEAWVRKESIFKKTGGKALLPNRTEASAYHTTLRYVSIGEANFLISVASDFSKKTKFIYMEDL